MTHVIQQIVGVQQFDNDLIGRLPEVSGKLTQNAPLKQFAWLNVGGPAEVLFRPKDRDDLVGFIKNVDKDIPVTVLGVMSNCIVRDGGIPGVVVRFSRDFAQMENLGDNKIRVGAGTMDMNVALFALKYDIAGLEFYSGIPGTVGGALRMNAGAYGTETKDVLVSTDVLFPDGSIRTMTAEDMNMSYRKNGLPNDVIFLSAVLQGETGKKSDIDQRMQDIKNRRAETQPIRTKTGGSTFANPSLDDPAITKKAWELIDEAGCRGLTIGDAQMSEKHCNFMINTNLATAADLERLGEEVRRRVQDITGVSLRWEIKRLGVPHDKDEDIRAFMNA